MYSKSKLKEKEMLFETQKGVSKCLKSELKEKEMFLAKSMVESPILIGW